MPDKGSQNVTDERQQSHTSTPRRDDADVGDDKEQARQRIEETTDQENLARIGKASKESGDQPTEDRRSASEG